MTERTTDGSERRGSLDARSAGRAYPDWLNDAIAYEIYPQSFQDSDGDGIGDVQGIIDRLDHLVSLGVTLVWMNPVFDSPFPDAGYDVRDYYRVAPRYGTNEDLERLLREARVRGIRILLDLVPGHTSWEHPWFLASSRHERNEHTDWYVWTDRVWRSSEGLRAVTGLSERDGSYIANFFVCQPALNFGFADPEPGHPWKQAADAPGPMAVRREIREIMRFWLDRGAAGFRVDMAHSLVKQDPGRRATSAFWREIRAWLDADYPEAVLISEWGRPGESLPAGFHMDFLLHFEQAGYTSLFRASGERSEMGHAYGWSLFEKAGHGNVRAFLDEYLADLALADGRGLICIPSGNHDMGQRMAEGRDADDLAVVWAFLLTMPGVPFIYYGDEIGMRSVHGLPSKEGSYDRTGARTPMQWDDGLPNAGFSTGPAEALYLPLDPLPGRPTVAEQAADAGSLLSQVRTLAGIRHAHPALAADGAFIPLLAEPGVLPFVYERRSAARDGGSPTGVAGGAGVPDRVLSGLERVVVAVNPGAKVVEAHVPGDPGAGMVEQLYGPTGALAATDGGWTIRLPGVSAGIWQVR